MYSLRKTAMKHSFGFQLESVWKEFIKARKLFSFGIMEKKLKFYRYDY